jgi:hypothetical protein
MKKKPNFTELLTNGSPQNKSHTAQDIDATKIYKFCFKLLLMQWVSDEIQKNVRPDSVKCYVFSVIRFATNMYSTHASVMNEN